MAFDSLDVFFAMGGHGAYVWSAWAVAALAMVGSVVHARAEHHRLLRDIQRRVRRDTATPRTDHDAS
ncbi:heme exporter protein CcmD [Halomonas salinarum]|uniref:heme exporter protein CcmD n=1 Tax=Halomonas salinarum TaxID=1158993 RepID=UPI00143A23DD|nr:heme exporter protein CcmD [Halomonas salinarum]